MGARSAALGFDGGLHEFNVIRSGKISRVALRVLVAVLTLDVALHSKGSKFHAHRQ
jgi:hypothetical protein